MAGSDNNMMMSWLNDAFAMEQSIIEVLGNHVKDAKSHPQVQARLQQHLDATHRHADMVKSCIERLGGDTSSIKSGMSKMMGMIQGMSTGAAQDELIKNALQDYSTEHMEIASYTSLIAAAQDLGDTQTAETCRQILQDEQAMADFLIQQIPSMTTEFLHQQAATAD